MGLQTLKSLEDTKKRLQDVGINKGFLKRPLTAEKVIPTTDKWDWMKLKHWRSAKEESAYWRDSTQDGRKAFANYTSHKRLILKFNRKLKRLNIQKLYHPINKWKNKLKTFFNKEIQRATEIKHSSAAKITCFSSRGFRINSSTHMAAYKMIQYLLASSGSR